MSEHDNINKGSESNNSELKRREFLKASVAAPTVMATSSALNAHAQTGPSITPLRSLTEVPIETGIDRTWLGAEFWSNSLQDWRLRNGALLPIGTRGNVGAGRTVGLITRELNASNETAIIRARFRRQRGTTGEGLTGFLFGVGQGDLDFRAAALGQASGGEGGGILAAMDENGRLSFMDHGSEIDSIILSPMPSQTIGNIGPSQNLVTLELQINPRPDGNFSVTLIAADNRDNVLGTASLTSVPARRVIGGISLSSLSRRGRRVPGARWAITNIATGGDKVTHSASRALGPVIGTMYSLSRGVLRMTAQFMPIVSLRETNRGVARFQFRRNSSEPWQNGPRADISSAYVATFRMEGWDSSVPTQFRVIFNGQNETLYRGTIRREPNRGRELSIGLYSCILNSGRGLLSSPPRRVHRDEVDLGRYTRNNLYFPHTELVNASENQDPDIVVFCGDQYYEGSPIGIDNTTKETLFLSTLYRWYIWYWSFRDLTRDRPSIVLADDHDVLQGNLWGQGGRTAPDNDQERGGYRRDPDLVRRVFNFQCDHNPDPFDPETIRNDIPVYYSDFVYGGVSFAIIEDRKFKTGPNQEPGFDFENDARLIGRRQLRFLRDWADIDADLPKVVLSQTPWATLQTTSSGAPRRSPDSNGFYPRQRDLALRRVKEAGAIMLAGDQHLGTLVRHGIDRFDDGPVQFAGPAGAALFMRWLEPRPALSNQRNRDPNTGDFIDFYGNRVNLVAVANPQISQERFDEGLFQRSNALLDRRLKSEGFGIVRVDKRAQQFIFECWASNGPFGFGSRRQQQYDGWPFTLNFDDV